MSSRFLLPLIALLISICPASLPAQSRSLISIAAAKQFGLERMWYTQIDMDTGRGRLAGIHYHVSPTRLHTVFEFYALNKMHRFSEWDLDPYGKRIGREEAKRQAEEKRALIGAEVKAAGQKWEQPVIDERVIPEVTIYATSERGSVQAFDGETGQTRWSIAVGRPDFPTTGAGANDDFVAVCNGSTLYVVKSSDGTMAFERKLVGAPGAGPGVSHDFLYVPTVDGSVEVYSLNKPRQPVQVLRSYGRTLLQPLASSRTVAWVSDKGVLYSANGTTNNLRYRLKMPDISTVGPAFLAPDRIIAASIDGHLYCVHEALGNVQWRLSTGESVNVPPFTINGVAYLITDQGSLFAVDGETGKEKWWTSGVRGFLAGTNERLYCTDLSGNVAVLDSRSGTKLGSFPAPGLDFRFQNMISDRIIIGSSSGLIQAFREKNREYPLVHSNVDEVKKKVVVEVKQGNGDDPNPMPMGNAPAADPFGAPAPAPAADPFGGGADPFGAPAKPAPMPKPKDDFDPFK